MIDIFLQKDVRKLLQNKKVVFIGDSNIRALYKDLLCLLQDSKFIPARVLRHKGENTCFGDNLMYGGPRSNNRTYKEERKKFHPHYNTTVSFYFICRVFDDYVESILKILSKGQNVPDVIIINSCVWDVTRWGPKGVENYKKNLVLLMEELKNRLPDCHVIWLTAPPISGKIKGGFLVKEIEFLAYSLRYHVMEANQYAREIVVRHGFDVLDSHYHLKLQIHRRSRDGIHWEFEAVRYITNLLLTHISIAWNVPLPHRYNSVKLKESLPISEVNHKVESKQEQTESVSHKLSSVVVKSESHEKLSRTKVKRKTEEFVSPPRSKKNKNSLREKNHNESHHTYLKKEDSKRRHNRIRQWGKSSQKPPLLKTPYNSPHSFSQDSGYLTSPNHTPYNVSIQRFIDSPRHIPLPPSPYHPPTYSPFSNPDLLQYQPVHDASPIRSVQVAPYGRLVNGTRRAICQSPHFYDQFSVNSRLQFQPIINFASTDSIPFGISF